MQDAVSTKTAAVSSKDSSTIDKRSYICDVVNCTRNGYADGLCNAHYMRRSKGKDMLAPLRARKRDDTCSECSILTGSKGGWGLCANHYRNTRRALLKDALIAAMGGKCSECEVSYPREVYDFHHIESKTDAPGDMLSNKSIESIAEELSKCVLLCANCHRMEHYKNEY